MLTEPMLYGRSAMTLGERCDEIIRVIDAALGTKAPEQSRSVPLGRERAVRRSAEQQQSATKLETDRTRGNRPSAAVGGLQ